MRIRIIKRPDVSLEHGIEVDQEYTAVWVDPPQAKDASIRIIARGSGARVSLQPGEWEEV